MSAALRYRFWLESILGGTTAVLALVTLVWRDWIEAVFRADPDKGNGLAEWLVVAVLFLVTLTSAVAARREWRRGRALPASAT
ncbi:MAG: ABC transporter permease [Frankiaceae bacterium]